VRTASLICVLAMFLNLMPADRALAHVNPCAIVTRDEVEQWLEERVVTVVSGSDFCTHISAGPVVAVALRTFASVDAALEAQAGDRVRFEAEKKVVTDMAGVGDRALRAQGSHSIEYQVVLGRNVLDFAIAGEDEKALARHDGRMARLLRTASSRL
jgi:hypothetical protein